MNKIMTFKDELNDIAIKTSRIEDEGVIIEILMGKEYFSLEPSLRMTST